jgi:hypothetical protein
MAAHDGEELLAVIDPLPDLVARQRLELWLGARATLAELPRLLLPGCDQRCAGLPHDPDRRVALSDLALDPVDAAGRPGPTWFAGAPAMRMTPTEARLQAGTRLQRLSRSSVDPGSATPGQAIYRVIDGRLAGQWLIVVCAGPAPLLPTLASAMIALDHPPALDPAVAVRLLASGWAAVERGLPYED